MDTATAILSALIALALAFAAFRKLSHRPEVVASYARVGVPEERLNALALVLLAGAGGLLAAVAWPPIGIAAAAGVAVYFVLAIRAHIRFSELGDVGTPIALELAAIAALVLHLAAL